MRAIKLFGYFNSVSSINAAKSAWQSASAAYCSASQRIGCFDGLQRSIGNYR